ncbi:protein starmaker-like [Diaphorina citri]|uniref:Protein starmaker-like n=1 Tax=Diaphorina citri TaxID=121845 RepID=A0A3Q0JGN7_DIACI|nr:protein starmaker-like [Diaphorina citri]
MSWFDTSNIVSLAKSTLKEAQKTIDKALDITEEEDSEEQTKKDDGASKVASEPSTPFASSSLWGSFTGSFFEATTPDSSTGHVHSEDTTSTSISKQPNATPSLHESFSLIKQRSHPSSNTGKQKVLSRSFDQPPSKSIDLKSKEKSSRKTGGKSAERTSEKSIESVEKTDEKSVKSDEETSEKGSDKSSEKDGTSSSKKTALEELEKTEEDVEGGVRDEHKSKRKHSTDGDKTKEDEEKGGKECGKGKDNSESKSKEPQDCEQKGKDKRKKDESGDKIETDKSESNDQLEKIHNEDLEKKTKEVDEVESNVSEVSSKSNDMKTDPNPSVADPNSAIDAESNVIDSVRNVKDSLSRNIGDETDAKLPGKAKIDPTQSNLQSKDTETRKDASISQIQESGRKSDVQSTQDETPVKESKGSSQSETVCDKTRDLIANTLPSHGTGKTDDKPYDTKEISTTEEGKHTDTLLDKTTEGFCIAESDGLESSSSVEVAKEEE